MRGVGKEISSKPWSIVHRFPATTDLVRIASQGEQNGTISALQLLPVRSKRTTKKDFKTPDYNIVIIMVYCFQPDVEILTSAKKGYHANAYLKWSRMANVSASSSNFE